MSSTLEKIRDDLKAKDLESYMRLQMDLTHMVRGQDWGIDEVKILHNETFDRRIMIVSYKNGDQIFINISYNSTAASLMEFAKLISGNEPTGRMYGITSEEDFS